VMLAWAWLSRKLYLSPLDPDCIVYWVVLDTSREPGLAAIDHIFRLLEKTFYLPKMGSRHAK
jgi:hypothetical protein